MEYDADFGKSLDIGLHGEKLLRRISEAYIAMGENAVEVKNDVEVSETGKVYIECLSRGKPSGIATSKSLFWALILNGPEFKREIIFIIETERLRDICKRYPYVIRGGDSNTSLGHLIPITYLVRPNHSVYKSKPVEPQIGMFNKEEKRNDNRSNTNP